MRYLILTLFLCANTCFAQESKILNNLPAGSQELAARVHQRDWMTYVAYVSSSNGMDGDIHFTTLNSQTAPSHVTSTGKVNASLQRGPEFAIAPNGTIHLVWMEARVGSDPDIWYSRSTNNGTDWSEPSDVSQDKMHMTTQDFPSVAIDSTGRVYVAWLDGRDMHEGTTKNEHIYLTRSEDNGATWSAPSRAEHNPGDAGGSCECCRTAIAASKDGHVYIAYRTNMSNERDIFVARSMDQGKSFDTSIRVQTAPWMLMACPATGPMIALDPRENLHIVYRSAGDNDRAAIYYNLLPAGMDRTFKEIALTDKAGSGANYADVVVMPSGYIAVAFQQSGIIQMRTSYDGGNSWNDPSPLDNVGANQSYAVVSFDPITTKLTAMWQDDRRDQSDVIIWNTPIAESTQLPMVLEFNREVRSDSVRYFWALMGARAATWLKLVTTDTTILTIGDDITLPRWINERSAISLIPVSAIGEGNGQTLKKLDASVSAPENNSHVPLTMVCSSGGEIDIPSERLAVWHLCDLTGREITILRSEASNILKLPQLVDGVYFLRSSSGVQIKLLIQAR